MKPLLFRVPTVDDRSFRVQEDNEFHFYDRLHFHPEIQLTLILEGQGTQVVGDKIDRFRPYDMLLLGDNLPHVFRSDPEYFQPNSHLRSVSWSIFFRAETLSNSLFSLPELAPLNHLLREARHGVRLRCGGSTSLTERFESLPHLRPFEQIVSFLLVLDELASNSSREILSTMAYEQPRRPDDHQRLDQIFNYILQHYDSPITLEDVADVANLTPSAFCRFFKIHTRKTFSHLLNEVRVEHACRLLHQSGQSISQIAFACGYTNLSNFNRQFKVITGMTPKEYLKTSNL
ncbi:helix-turn-helix domain-containing protein [Tellurirhabdus bombi]|uniref:helix-turn-helix domain-containing protein n=1 Tax=Tellurirhabdus bombi TaxID=2907205 RepID=UPI001F283236|nr:AraC family transcriptional regulator [Tellurirhabdus bombi]